MRFNSHARPAVATPADAERIMGHYGDSSDEVHAHRRVNMLFGPAPDHHPYWLANRDHASIGTLLQYEPRDAERTEDLDLRCLTAAAALGRAAGAGTSAPEYLGIILLAGELTARTLYHIIAAEHGAFTVAALASANARMWPLAATERPDDSLGHPGMAIGRLLTTYGSLLRPWQRQALQVLGRAFSEGNQYLAVARCVAHVVPELPLNNAETLDAVRQQVLAVRLAGIQLAALHRVESAIEG